jgi:hypothetical protein
MRQRFRGTAIAVLAACGLGSTVNADLPRATLVGAAGDARLSTLTPAVNDRLGLAESAAFELSVEWRPGQPVIAFLPLGGEIMILDLQPVSVRSDDFEVVVRAADGTVSALADPGAPRTLRGEVIGYPGSAVAASIMDDGLHARVILESGRDLWIEPIGGRVAGAVAGDHIAYDNDAVLDVPGTCATDASLAAPGLTHAAGVAGQQGVLSAFSCTDLACETDDEFIQALGPAGAQSFIEQVVLMINMQYESEVGITHQITAISLQSGSGDPYGNSPNASNLLNSFRSHWESSPPTSNQYDAAQMFTGRNLSGSTIGIAWLGSICTSYKYSLVQALFNGSTPNACAYDLSAHELGHNWGADHCSCSNPAYTMNSFITCANRFSPTQTVNEIIAFRSSRSCIGTCGGGGDPVGACCLPSGCAVTTAATCSSQGGSYQGDGSGCSPDPCPAPTGACCLGDDTCVETTQAGCSGTYQGDGTTCASNPCTPSGDATVQCIIYSTKGGPQRNKHLVVTVVVEGAGGGPVSGASVSMTLSRSGGGSWSFGGTTDSAGEVDFTLLQAADGCYTSDVTALSGVTGNPPEPTNGFVKTPGAPRDEDCAGGTPDNPCP